MRALNHNTQLLSFECELPAAVSHCSVHIKSFVRTRGGYRPSLTDTTIDFCSLLGGTYNPTDLLARSLMKYVLKDWNTTRACPIEGTVAFRDIRLTPDFVLNAWVPPDRYRLNLRFYDPSDNSTVILVAIYFSFD